jgi:cold-inducible RNA-binding protein
MATKLYVGGLAYSVTEKELEAMFAEFGKVTSAAVINDRDTGKSKGFGFVEMSDDSEAKAAITALNGKEFNGRSLTVNEARAQ